MQNECKAMASIKHYQPLSTNMLDIIIIMGVIIVIIIILFINIIAIIVTRPLAG